MGDRTVEYLRRRVETLGAEVADLRKQVQAQGERLAALDEAIGVVQLRHDTEDAVRGALKPR